MLTRVCVCLSVCLYAAVRPHYYTDPNVTWGRGRGCPLVVHYWADLQSGHGLRCYGNITLTLVTSMRPVYTFGVELLGTGSGNMASDIVQANALGRRFDILN